MIFASKMEKNILPLVKSNYLLHCGPNVQTEQNTWNFDYQLGIAYAMMGQGGGSSGLSHISLGSFKLVWWDLFQKLDRIHQPGL